MVTSGFPVHSTHPIFNHAVFQTERYKEFEKLQEEYFAEHPHDIDSEPRAADFSRSSPPKEIADVNTNQLVPCRLQSVPVSPEYEQPEISTNVQLNPVKSEQERSIPMKPVHHQRTPEFSSGITEDNDIRNQPQLAIEYQPETTSSNNEIIQSINNLAQVMKQGFEKLQLNTEAKGKRLDILESNFRSLQGNFHHFSNSVCSSAHESSPRQQSEETASNGKGNDKDQGKESENRGQKKVNPSQFYILEKPRNVNLVYKEFKYGVASGSSLITLEQTYGPLWRSEPSVSRQYYTRLMIYNYIEKWAPRLGEDHVVDVLEGYRIAKGNKSIDWLVENLISPFEM